MVNALALLPVLELRPDCTRCVGLCCVAPAFARSADFAVDKPAGTPCANLQEDFRCGIHTDLRVKGFRGCTVFDCLGAGQRVTSAFDGRDWRTPGVAGPMFASFALTRQVHELLWYLDEARARAPDPELDEVHAALLDDDFAAADLVATQDRVAELLRRASERVRAGADTSPRASMSSPGTVDLRGAGRPDTPVSDHDRTNPARAHRRGADQRGAVPGPDHHRAAQGAPRADHSGAALPGAPAPDHHRAPHPGVPAPDHHRAALPGVPAPDHHRAPQPGPDHSRADLVGVRWRGADLRAATLRGALLLGADLRAADLRLTDLLGADLRGADLRGADLSTSLFVTPMQVAAARGDRATLLPARVSRPPHWLT